MVLLPGERVKWPGEPCVALDLLFKPVGGKPYVAIFDLDRDGRA